MMKNTMKTMGKMFLLVLVTAMFFAGTVSAAKPSASKVKSAYQRYYRNHYVGEGYYGLSSKLYDFNHDGIKEMVVSYEAGNRYGYDFFTYRNGKVSRMISTRYGCTGLAVIPGTKRIVVSTSDSAFRSSDTVYLMKKGKMKKVRSFIYSSSMYDSSVTYYRNSKKISKYEYDAFENKLRWI